MGVTVNSAALLETLAAELEHPRELTSQVLRRLSGTYDVVEREGVGPFLAERLSGLEDDEIDLLFSPLFTPGIGDQAVIADRLGREAVAKNLWPDLTAQLVSRPVVAHFTLDGASFRVPLRAVTVERFLHRLRLDGAIPDALFALIERAPAGDRPTLQAIARRAVWDAGARRGILERYLANAIARGDYTLSDACDLLGLVESHKPPDADHLLTQLPRWRETLQRVLDTGLSGPSPFFSQHTEYQHGGERDQRVVDQSRVQAKRNELDFLRRLEETLERSFRDGSGF
jgi:hypothetical protein